MFTSHFPLYLGLLLILAVVLFKHFRPAQAMTGPAGRARRLARVQTAGWWLTGLTVFAVVFTEYAFVGFCLGWHLPGGDACRWVVLGQVYATAVEMPGEVFWLVLVKQGIQLFASLMLVRLFWFYTRGILFTNQTVLCIRVQGYCLILGGLIDLQLHGAMHASSVSLNPVIYGLLVIFIAWIMDEGRKLQEEQELTV